MCPSRATRAGGGGNKTGRRRWGGREGRREGEMEVAPCVPRCPLPLPKCFSAPSCGAHRCPAPVLAQKAPSNMHSTVPSALVVTECSCPLSPLQPCQGKCCKKISFSLAGKVGCTRRGCCFRVSDTGAESEPRLHLSLFLVGPKPKHSLVVSGTD